MPWSACLLVLRQQVQQQNYIFLLPGATFQMSKQPMRLQTCVMAAGIQPGLDSLRSLVYRASMGELLVRRGAGSLLKSGLDISSEAGAFAELLD